MFKSEVIFSMEFPEESSDDVEMREDGSSEADTTCVKSAPPTAEEFLLAFSKKYVFRLRPDAHEKSKQFISHAIRVCKNWRISTEIRKNRYNISVSMDIGLGWFSGDIKKELDELISFADDIFLYSYKGEPRSLNISMSYFTHDRYTNEAM